MRSLNGFRLRIRLFLSAIFLACCAMSSMGSGHPIGPRTSRIRALFPVRGQTGLALVSLRTAQSSPVYLDDAGDIGGEIIRKDSRIFLAIDRVSEVTEPISEPLRKLGVRSLREHLKEPEQVTGTGNPVNADENILVRFRELRSSQFQRHIPKAD